MIIKESHLRKIIREEIKQSLSEMKMGIHDPKAQEMVAAEKKETAQKVLSAVDAILSQFQAIHSGQGSRESINKARANAKVVYEFVKNTNDKRVKGSLPPSDVVEMARALAKNPEEAVEQYIRPVLKFKKTMAASIN